MLILPRPRFTQPQQGWAVAREYRAHLSGLMLPSLGLTALTGQAVTRVGANGFVGGSLHEAAWRHTDTTSFYRAPIVNTTLNDNDGPAVACLGRFRLRQAPAADRQAIFGLGSSVGGGGNTLFITAVDSGNNIAALCGTGGFNPGWDFLGVNAGDFQWHTVLMEAFTSASGFTFVKRFSIDGKVLPEIGHPGNGGSLPYDFLCALGSRRTVDLGGELHADVSLVAGWIFPKLGDHFFTEDQAARLTRNPYAELFAPASRRLWVPGGAPSGVTGTASPTNANDTSAASGSPIIVGTSARTNANDASSASGSPIVSGTVARTNANDTAVASGQVGLNVVGTAAITNANDFSTASGSPVIVGTSARTNANDTAVANGSVGSAVFGTAAVTEQRDASAASGSPIIQGTAAVANGADLSTASGSPIIVGTATYTNFNDIAAASGWAGVVQGTVAATNANDFCAAFGIVGNLVIIPGGSMGSIYGVPVRKNMVVNATAPAASDPVNDIGNGYWPSFHASLAGTGALTATIDIQARNVADGTWATIGTISLSGTGSVGGKYEAVSRYMQYRANVTALTGTGATLNVAMAG